MTISKIDALEILDSRGNPTVKGYVILDNGIIGSASVPSGASTGTYEAHELRDGGKRYLGNGVEKAVENVKSKIGKELNGKSISDLKTIDKVMIDLDATENKTQLGANAILAVSLAAVRACALSEKKPLWKVIQEYYFPEIRPDFPRLMVNVINGGAHANWSLDIQEFMLSPVNKQPSDSVRMASEIFNTLKGLLKKDGHTISVGDEGGFAPQLGSNDKAFEYINSAIAKAGYTNEDIHFATDVAASEFYKDGKYELRQESLPAGGWTSAELAEFYSRLIKKYNVMSFEDPFDEDDWEAFSSFTEKIGSNHLVVGDDIYVTNRKRIQKGIDTKATNAILIKVNQIGSLLETVQAINLAREAGWKVVISHRSGETEDPFIADLAVACAADFIKAGSMSRSDRLAKYNRLIEIEKMEMK